MRRIISLSLSFIIFSIILIGCGKVDVENVHLSDQEVKLQLKDTYNLSATVSPKESAEPMVYWESSDTSVVTVKSGVVTAVGEGKAEVKAFTSNGVSDVCRFTVDNILTEKLTINKKNFTMMAGTKGKIEYTIVPENVTNNALVWDSSDEKIATVDGGIVKALSVGECDITATSNNGVKAKCHLTVKVKPTGVRLNSHATTVATNKTVQLSATVLPEKSAYKEVKWESSNSSVATVDSNGKVTGIKTGKCKIYVTTYNDKYDYCNVTVTQGTLTYKGNGNKTLKHITVSEGVYAITMTHKGDGVFNVIGSDGDGRAYNYVDVKGDYSGTNLYAKGKNDGVEDATIRISATGEWTIKIKAITFDGTDNITGSGECVSPMFQGTNNKNTVKLKNVEDGDFTVFLFDQNGKQIGVLCDELDDFEGTVNATLDKNKYYFIVVKSQGEWWVDFDNDSKETKVKNTN